MDTRRNKQMSIEQLLGAIVSAITIAVAFIGSVRWLVKHYLSELKPNSGSSIKDQVNRLESRVDEIFFLLLESKPKSRKKTFVSKGEE
jgi:flagellar biogenesis protein FliO